MSFPCVFFPNDVQTHMMPHAAALIKQIIASLFNIASHMMNEFSVHFCHFVVRENRIMTEWHKMQSLSAIYFFRMLYVKKELNWMLAEIKCKILLCIAI